MITKSKHTCTHTEENSTVSVVLMHEPISSGIHKLVACLSLQEAGVKVQPVAGYVNSHAQLKQKGSAGIESAECGQQAHSSAPVSQHVQHGAKFGALAQGAGGMAVHSIQEARQDVAPAGSYVVRWHEPEG